MAFLTRVHGGVFGGANTAPLPVSPSNPEPQHLWPSTLGWRKRTENLWNPCFQSDLFLSQNLVSQLGRVEHRTTARPRSKGGMERSNINGRYIGALTETVDASSHPPKWTGGSRRTQICTLYWREAGWRPAPAPDKLLTEPRPDEDMGAGRAIIT